MKGRASGKDVSDTVNEALDLAKRLYEVRHSVASGPVPFLFALELVRRRVERDAELGMSPAERAQWRVERAGKLEKVMRLLEAHLAKEQN